jgi:hypothetical protein
MVYSVESVCGTNNISFLSRRRERGERDPIVVHGSIGEQSRFGHLEESDISKLVVVALGVPLVLGQQGVDLLSDFRAGLEDIVSLVVMGYEARYD